MARSNWQTRMTMSSAVGVVAQALESYKVDATAILQEVAVDLPRENSPMDRVSVEKMTHLYELAVKATGDPGFGLKVGLLLTPASLHALGYSLQASESLRDFCEQLQRYERLVSTNATVRLDVDDDLGKIITHPTNEIVCAESIDSWTAFVVRFMRAMSPQFNPVKIELPRPEPASGKTVYEEFFHAPVRFGCRNSVIYISRADLDEPLRGGSREIVLELNKIMRSYLSKLDHQDVVTQAELCILELLPKGQVDRQLVAERLNMSVRNLQVKLERQGTCFKVLLDETRRELCRSYIDRKNVSVTELTYLVGFSDTSNFTRAFKRWYGKSPSKYRRKTTSVVE